MTKEQILALMMDSVDTFSNRTDELKSNPEFKAAFIDQFTKVGEEYNRANSCDQCWLDDEFGKWFKEQFPNIKDFKEQMINLGLGDLPH